MSDLISRQAAIDVMWKALYAYEDLTEKQFMEHEELELEDWFQHRIFVQRMHEECMKAVESLPSAEPKTGEWIPCSERLPNEKGMYLVTSRKKATAEELGFDLDDVEVKKMRFDENGWRVPKHIPEWINGVIHTTVLAWMPLPKPYREDGEV